MQAISVKLWRFLYWEPQILTGKKKSIVRLGAMIITSLYQVLRAWEAPKSISLGVFLQDIQAKKVS